jgi:hypothetical protein
MNWQDCWVRDMSHNKPLTCTPLRGVQVSGTVESVGKVIFREFVPIKIKHLRAGKYPKWSFSADSLEGRENANSWNNGMA